MAKTENQLLSTLSSKIGQSKSETKNIIEELKSLIHAELNSSKEFKLFGLGKFKVLKRSARMGRNPATGATIKIAAKTVVKFSPSKSLKEKYNRK